jgi:hypothetical protein
MPVATGVRLHESWVFVLSVVVRFLRRLRVSVHAFHRLIVGFAWASSVSLSPHVRLPAGNPRADSVSL